MNECVLLKAYTARPKFAIVVSSLAILGGLPMSLLIWARNLKQEREREREWIKESIKRKSYQRRTNEDERKSQEGVILRKWDEKGEWGRLDSKGWEWRRRRCASNSICFFEKNGAPDFAGVIIGTSCDTLMDWVPKGLNGGSSTFWRLIMMAALHSKLPVWFESNYALPALGFFDDDDKDDNEPTNDSKRDASSTHDNGDDTHSSLPSHSIYSNLFRLEKKMAEWGNKGLCLRERERASERGRGNQIETLYPSSSYTQREFCVKRAEGREERTAGKIGSDSISTLHHHNNHHPACWLLAPNLCYLSLSFSPSPPPPTLHFTLR